MLYLWLLTLILLSNKLSGHFNVALTLTTTLTNNSAKYSVVMTTDSIYTSYVVFPHSPSGKLSNYII